MAGLLKIFSIFLFLISGLITEIRAQSEDKKPVCPGIVFSKTYTEELKGIYLAKNSGDVLVHSEQWLNFYDANGKLLWGKEKLNYVTGAGVSRDGAVIIFQNSAVPKKAQQTTLELTLHILDHQGQELLSKANPHRYFDSILSPGGNYIVFGEPLAKKIYVYDRAMNPLWERETYIWYIGFDPDEKFIYDSTSGMVLNLSGRRVWELQPGMKFLSISSGAEIILSQPFLTVLDSQKKVYLTNRVSLEEVILDGYGGGVSYDGSLVAYQTLGREIELWRTRELFEKNKEGKSFAPLWKGDIYLVKLVHFSIDSKTLFIYGETGQKSGKAFLIDVNQGNKVWEKEWLNPLLKYTITEDNRFFLTQTGPKSIDCFCLR